MLVDDFIISRQDLLPPDDYSNHTSSLIKAYDPILNIGIFTSGSASIRAISGGDNWGLGSQSLITIDGLVHFMLDAKHLGDNTWIMLCRANHPNGDVDISLQIITINPTTLEITFGDHILIYTWVDSVESAAISAYFSATGEGAESGDNSATMAKMEDGRIIISHSAMVSFNSTLNTLKRFYYTKVFSTAGSVITLQSSFQEDLTSDSTNHGGLNTGSIGVWDCSLDNSSYFRTHVRGLGATGTGYQDTVWSKVAVDDSGNLFEGTRARLDVQQTLLFVTSNGDFVGNFSNNIDDFEVGGRFDGTNFVINTSVLSDSTQTGDNHLYASFSSSGATWVGDTVYTLAFNFYDLATQLNFGWHLNSVSSTTVRANPQPDIITYPYNYNPGGYTQPLYLSISQGIATSVLYLVDETPQATLTVLKFPASLPGPFSPKSSRIAFRSPSNRRTL